VQPVVIGPSFGDPANRITYDIQVSNAGPSNANGVTVTDVLPPGLSLNTAATTAANGSAACVAGPPVVCNFGTVNNGASSTLKIITNAAPATLAIGAASGSVSNSVNVASTSTIDPVASNNQSLAVSTSLIGEADVSLVSIVGAPNPVLVGNNVTYTITVNNIGPHPSQPLTVNNTLPTGVNFVSSSSPAFNCAGTICTINSLGSGISAQFTIVGNVTAPAVPAGTSQALSESASITVNAEDPVAGNNSLTQSANPIAHAAADLHGEMARNIRHRREGYGRGRIHNQGEALAVAGRRHPVVRREHGKRIGGSSLDGRRAPLEICVTKNTSPRSRHK
jgi:uncharacterized repeat protein (TIGR01451 family)